MIWHTSSTASGTTGHPKARNRCITCSPTWTASNIFKSPARPLYRFLPMFSFPLWRVLLQIYGVFDYFGPSVSRFSNLRLKQALLKRPCLGIPAIYTAMTGENRLVFQMVQPHSPVYQRQCTLWRTNHPRFQSQVPAKLLGYGLSEASRRRHQYAREAKKPAASASPCPVWPKAVDEELVKMPRGEVGELIVRGGSVMPRLLNAAPPMKPSSAAGRKRAISYHGAKTALSLSSTAKDLIISRSKRLSARNRRNLQTRCRRSRCRHRRERPLCRRNRRLRQWKRRTMDLGENRKSLRHLRTVLANFQNPQTNPLQRRAATQPLGKVLKRVLEGAVWRKQMNAVPSRSPVRQKKNAVEVPKLHRIFLANTRRIFSASSTCSCAISSWQNIIQQHQKNNVRSFRNNKRQLDNVHIHASLPDAPVEKNKRRVCKLSDTDMRRLPSLISWSDTSCPTGLIPYIKSHRLFRMNSIAGSSWWNILSTDAQAVFFQLRCNSCIAGDTVCLKF